MFDLFGDQITTPQCAPSALPKGINSGIGFVDWWLAYPTNSRKAEKQQCLDKWARYGCAERAAHILAYTLWMKTQQDWTKDNGAFVCAPKVFLNRQGWLEWVEPKKAPPKHDVLAELRAHVGSKPSAETLARIKAIKEKVC